MKITIEMTEEQITTYNKLKLTRKIDDQQFVDQIFARGLYDISYRSTRNKQQWEAFKLFKAEQKNN
jgi:hypothetical protein